MSHWRSILIDRLSRAVRERFEDWKFQFAHEWTNLVDRHLGNLMPYGDAETLRLQLGWLASNLLHEDDVRRCVHTTDLPHVEAAFRDWFMDDLLSLLDSTVIAPNATPLTGDTAVSPEPPAPADATGDGGVSPDDHSF